MVPVELGLTNAEKEKDGQRIVGLNTENMETEYSIHVDEKIREDVSAMCNLSQGIKDNTLVDVIINMYENNFTIDQIALATKKSVEEVKAIIEKRMPMLA